MFVFEIDMDTDRRGLSGADLEDVLYNCLDLCRLYGKQPHFLLSGADAAHNPDHWRALELLRAEGAAFSALGEPERTELLRLRAQSNPPLPAERVVIHRDGRAYYGARPLGSALDDRLADLWAVWNAGGAV